MQRTQIYLSDEVHNDLNILSETTGKNKSSIVREALEQYLRNHSHQTRIANMRKACGMWEDRSDDEFKKIFSR